MNVDRDEILRQGMDIAGKLRDEAGAKVAQHEQQIKDVLGKVANFVNDKTGGQYAGQVGKAADFIEQGVDKLAESGRTEPGSGTQGPDESPPA